MVRNQIYKIFAKSKNQNKYSFLQFFHSQIYIMRGKNQKGRKICWNFIFGFVSKDMLSGSKSFGVSEMKLSGTPKTFDCSKDIEISARVNKKKAKGRNFSGLGSEDEKRQRVTYSFSSCFRSWTSCRKPQEYQYRFNENYIKLQDLIETQCFFFIQI